MQATGPQTRTSEARRELLDDGRWVSIRPIDTADASALSAFYAGLSPESIRRRFLSSQRPTEWSVRHFADPSVGGVVAVLIDAGPNDGAIVGHGSVQPCGDGEVELAFAVSDAFQGRGIGTRLMRAALDEARRLGAHRVTASMLIDNVRMRRLLLGAGWPIASDRLDGGVEDITLALAAERRPDWRNPPCVS